MSLVTINNELKSEISVKESLGSLIANSIQSANIVVQGLNLATIYGTAYMISEMGGKGIEYNPRNGQLGVKS